MKHDGLACTLGKHSTSYPAAAWCPTFRQERLEMHQRYCQEAWMYAERKALRKAAKKRVKL